MIFKTDDYCSDFKFITQNETICSVLKLKPDYDCYPRKTIQNKNE